MISRVQPSEHPQSEGKIGLFNKNLYKMIRNLAGNGAI